MQTLFSINKTNDTDINMQITEQHVADSSKLQFGRGTDISFVKCNQGISPFNCIPLSEYKAR